ncbi:MAG: hypothetical protein CMI16_05910 [Opitutaceae bacterium]|nr:hypothetical protein [Opitutaceae bacterium]
MLRRPPGSAFTLIELLTVITIIGILAGIVIGVGRRAGIRRLLWSDCAADQSGCPFRKRQEVRHYLFPLAGAGRYLSSGISFFA